MKTKKELRVMLREAGCTPSDKGTMKRELWMDANGFVKAFKHMVHDELNRCICCGEINEGPSAACNARHENKDCNCFAKEVA